MSYWDQPLTENCTIIKNGWLEEIRTRRMAGEYVADIAEDYAGVSKTLVSHATKDIPHIEAIRNKLDRSIDKRIFSDKQTAASVDRFWSRVSKSSTANGCWEWTGATHPISGYGRVSIRMIAPSKKDAEYTHRVSYYLSRGRWPKKGTHIAHQCDNPCCVRPSHLYEGTPRENHYDAVVRNGKEAWRRKLSNEDIKDIIDRYQSTDDVIELSKEYGVSTSYIYMLGLRNHSRADAVLGKNPSGQSDLWEPWEDALILEEYPASGTNIPELREHRTAQAISSRATRTLGVYYMR